MRPRQSWASRRGGAPTSARPTATATPARWPGQSVAGLGGEVDGIRLLSPDTVELIFEEQIRRRRPRAGCHCASASATGCRRPSGAVRAPRDACFWGGWGGSIVLADLDRRVTLAYMMNNMAPGIIGSDRSEAYVRAAYACLD